MPTWAIKQQPGSLLKSTAARLHKAGRENLSRQPIDADSLLSYLARAANR